MSTAVQRDLWEGSVIRESRTRPSRKEQLLTSRLSHSKECLGSQTSLIGLLNLRSKEEAVVSIAEEGGWEPSADCELTPEDRRRKRLDSSAPKEQVSKSRRSKRRTVAPPLKMKERERKKVVESV